MSNNQAFDIGSLHAAYADGWPVSEMIDLVLSRIEQAGDPGIFITIADRAVLLEAAAALGPFDLLAKPLWGIPFAVKDNIDVAGLPTTAACPDYAYHPERDATVVRLLKEAGAIVIGKTNLDQFATGLVGVRSPYPIPCNAIAPELVPGGSSSGSAIATARGIVSFALGTDTAGSGRIPAGLNNIIGLKPSLGVISTTGVIPACRTLDCVSIFALTVDDAWRVFETAARFDAEDSYSKHVADLAPSPLPPVLKIGIPAREDRLFFGDEPMEQAYDAAIDQLNQFGHHLVEIPFADFYAVARLLYEGAWVAERYAAIRDFFDSKPDALHPVTRGIYGAAKSLTAADAFSGFYALRALQRKLAPVIASVDLFCVPTAPRHYTVAELEAEPIRENARLGTYTNFVNLLDLCGITVPMGTRGDGLPASVTLLAPTGKDHVVASLARRLHRDSSTLLGATNWPLPSYRPISVPAETNMIDLVVVGAHLSGLPLNHQLQTLKARFLRAARTASSYRLYALPGQEPPKPGLVRVEEEKGAMIDVEVWQLTPEAFGHFVAAIPAPLGIGTIVLADGASCKGFLVEPVALAGALDITGYGGWRDYLKSA